MTGYTAEELEIIALIERMQDRRLTAAEAAIAAGAGFCHRRVEQATGRHASLGGDDAGRQAG
jgi:hypothetical protein